MPSDLLVAWCEREAAKLACERWHYSKCLPVGRLATIGAWENGKFIGAVIFGHGANKIIGSPYRLNQYECIELVRIALTKHAAPVSRICAIAMKLLKQKSPSLKLIVSYADTGQGHHGGVYQAMNWVYAGVSKGDKEYFWKGEWKHNKTVCGNRGSNTGLPCRIKTDKHIYLFTLDISIKKSILALGKEYPKRQPCGITSESAGPAPTGQDGASPIMPLQSDQAVVE